MADILPGMQVSITTNDLAYIAIFAVMCIVVILLRAIRKKKGGKNDMLSYLLGIKAFIEGSEPQTEQGQRNYDSIIAAEFPGVLSSNDIGGMKTGGVNGKDN